MGVKFDQKPFGRIGLKVLRSSKIGWHLVLNNIDCEKSVPDLGAISSAEEHTASILEMKNIFHDCIHNYFAVMRFICW